MTKIDLSLQNETNRPKLAGIYNTPNNITFLKKIKPRLHSFLKNTVLMHHIGYHQNNLWENNQDDGANNAGNQEVAGTLKNGS